MRRIGHSFEFVDMLPLADHLHRLPQSLAVARWSARLSGCAVAVALARLLTLSYGEARFPVDEAPTRQEFPPAVREPISNWHLFGVATSSDKMVATTLALTLRGIVDHGDASRRIAIIAGQDQRDNAYHIGDTLPGGGVLDAVHPAYVVLLNGGRRESLALADRKAIRLPEGAAVSTAGPPPVDPGAPLGNANVLPVTDGRVVVGTRVSTPDIASLERTGLRRDDVITSIDGSELTGPAAGEVLQERLRKGGSATVVVRRDGREQTHNINLGR